MKTQYQIVVGEVGNELGHNYKSWHCNDEAAVRKARRLAQDYACDGWWMVRSESGEPISSGGRRTL